MTPEQALIALYARTAKRLHVQIGQAVERGAIGTAAYRAEQLAQIQRQLQQLGKATKPLILPVVFEPYVRGGQIVDLGIGRAAAAFQFTGPHPLAAQALADNLALRLGRARNLVGRRVDDVFRRVGLEEVAAGVVAGSARREVSSALQQRLVRDGLTGFVDARGARWQLDVYSEMVARTSTREAMSAGTRNRMAELALDLVTISSHANPCELCAAYDGNTYSANGKTPGYDVLDQWPPFHPNCIHVATPASANLDALEESLAEPSTSVPARPAPAPAPTPQPAALPAPKKGDRIHFSGGVDALKPGNAVAAGKGVVVEAKGDLLMVNAGTPSKPRWVQTTRRHIVEPPARAGVVPAAPVPAAKPFDRPILKSAELREHLAQDRHTLDAPGRAAVKRYTGDDFYDLNAGLRKGRTPPLARELDAAFGQVRPTSEPAMVYRGTALSRVGRLKVEPGQVIRDKAFTSSSARRSVAESFAKGGDDVLEIEVPPGARMLDVNRAAGSQFGGESEILLPRGARLLITKVTERKGKARVVRARLIVE